MSAINTYKKYNLHSAVPYTGGMSGYAKNRGETSGKGKHPGKVSGGKFPRWQHQCCRASRELCSNYLYEHSRIL